MTPPDIDPAELRALIQDAADGALRWLRETPDAPASQLAFLREAGQDYARLTFAMGRLHQAQAATGSEAFPAPEVVALLMTCLGWLIYAASQDLPAPADAPSPPPAHAGRILH